MYSVFNRYSHHLLTNSIQSLKPKKIQKMITRLYTIITLCLVVNLYSCSAFANTPRPFSRPAKETTLYAFELSLPMPTTIFIGEAVSMVQGHNPKSMNPSIDSDALSDVSQVVVDFSSCFRPSIFAYAMFNVFGRFMAIYADYLPDHTIHADKVLIQILYLCQTLDEIRKGM